MTEALPYDVDLTNCDREPIHLLGRVQGFGCLVAISSDWIIQHASENCATVLGIDLAAGTGTRLQDHLPPETLMRLRGRMQALAYGNDSVRIFGLDATGDGQPFDVSLHQSGRSFVLEFERKMALDDRDDLAQVHPLIARIRSGKGVQGMAQEAARGLRALSGFSRVKVYQFAADGSGTVIAESRDPAQDSYLNLRFPAADIPAQARELYRRSLLRLIGDVDDPGSAVVPYSNPEGQPLDLSLAVTRAVSPIHIEYLKNMGVGASMSVSILHRGKLWGLFACHHHAPLYIDYERRTAVELFAQLFSYELIQAENDAERAALVTAQGSHDRLMARLSSGEGLAASFDALADELAGVIAHDGFALYVDGQYFSRGKAPTEHEFLGLARFLNTAATSRIFATDCIVARYPGAETFRDRASGVLALPISRTPRDFIVLFRSEIAQQVAWAGNPGKTFETGPHGPRLTPRKSFEIWREVVKDHSAPWTEADLRSAESLRVTLLEVVLKLTDAANEERMRAQEQQELLIAELNHRVRNILSLIRGLVSQSRDGAEDVASFTGRLDGRIQSLARAHDQLTRKEWTPASLKALVGVEMGAYLDGAAGRLDVQGPDVLLVPDAFSTFALVIHELVTNSAKYGALSVPAGRVLLGIVPQPDGALVLEWIEQGGPAVRPPKRRGFGTTIIEKSIPFDLQGEARLQFLVTGIEARFMIPARYVMPAPADSVAVAPPDLQIVPAEVRAGAVLVVEDTIIIAMDAADILSDLGATTVDTASGVAEAMRLLDRARYDFVLLDVNLGRETSRPIAERLAAEGVPFALATGYGDSPEVREHYPPAPILQKPFTADMVKRVMAEALAPR
ncbi:HWE histidine kinase domain-containing protein [Frigidibacter sp. MR17.14]|uniref:HWE histidine kinase domain-containing protein n=1 Tax=Frigidibacter sp. MR17.14 TaxID=3126509 RepID=UPI003012FE2B